MKKMLNRLMRNYYLRQMEKQNLYENWITGMERQNNTCEKLAYQPKISILVPVYNVLDKHLVPCIESVLNQTYENWELCMADDCSTWKNVRKTLQKYEQNEKIKVVYRKENGHISRCTNSALEVATGEFVAFLDCDDVLAPNALYEVAKALNENWDLDFIYSDEDKLTENGTRRHTPFFKPDWSPDTFMSLMYTNHLGVYRKSIAEKVNGLRSEMNGAQDYDFTLRFMEHSDNERVGHIDKVLYHWRERGESAASNPEAKPYALEAAKRAKEEALLRRNYKGHLEYVDDVYQYRIVYEAPEDAMVSIIIPSKDNTELLFRCITSIIQYTEYKNYEIIIVDNGSSEDNRSKIAAFIADKNIKYCYEIMNFNFSHMCNMGANAAKGNYFLFLNDDIEIIDGEWLTRMLGQAALPHVGGVGAKLLYPNSDLIQHAGIINLEVGPSHGLCGLHDGELHYFCRNRMEYDYLAITAACLMVKKDKFYEVKGFEEGLPVAYNDVDLGFKLYEAGYYNVVRNDVILYHHESASRGLDFEDEKKMKRLMREREKLYKLHPQLEGKDPFYNRNLAPNKIDFSCRDIVEAPKMNRKIEKWRYPIKETQDITITIDCVQESESVLVKGWFYWKNPAWTNLARVYLALRNEYQQTFYFDVNRMIRKDVAAALQNGAYNTGFECLIPYENLRLNEESYQIGIVVEIPWLNIRRINWCAGMLDKVSEEFYREHVMYEEFELPEGSFAEEYDFQIEEKDETQGIIKGWAVSRTSRNNDYDDFIAAYQKNGKWYGRNVVRQRRPDIAAGYSTQTNVLWNGFIVASEEADIKEIKIVRNHVTGSRKG